MGVELPLLIINVVLQEKQWRLFIVNLNPLKFVDSKYNYSIYLYIPDQMMMNFAPAALCR